MERDHLLNLTSCSQSDFNSHAHVERDCTQFGVDKCPKYLNSHAHVERDLNNKDAVYECIDFNSHAHVERDYITPPFGM